MSNDSNRDIRTAGGLARLDELNDFEIADGEPDIRGWTVKTADGEEIGKVDNLIADPVAREVRYLEVKVKHELLATNADEHVIIPIGLARLNDDDDVVMLKRLPPTGLRGIPRFGRTRLTADHDRSLTDHYFGKNTAREKDEVARFFGARRNGRESASYLTW
jgi:photosynthetic reaction center H subunit